jgi:cytochrome c biogenesis protein CcdA
LNLDPAVGLAFGAGMVATVNPCGFAMLPAYLSYFLGLDDGGRDARAGVLRALRVGLAVSAGFVLVFGLLGLPISWFSGAIEQRLPWVTMVIGVGLVVLGVAMLWGFTPAVALPKLQKGGRQRELWPMFLFGVSYAVSSLSCTIPVFLVVVANSFTQRSVGLGLVTFLAYGLGMALVLMALTMALALAKQGLVRSLRGSLPYVNRVAGTLLVLAGGYLVYWGWYELQVLGGNLDPGGPAEAVLRWNSAVSNAITDIGAARIGLVLVVVIGVAVAVTALARGQGHPSDRGDGEAGTDVDADGDVTGPRADQGRTLST